jgi:diphosphate-dependent phosphofructokinase
MELSLLHKKRLSYRPVIPEILQNLNEVVLRESKDDKKGDEALRNLFPKTFDAYPFVLEKGMGARRPLKIGALFSGGQAPGGHNVLAGLFHGIKEIDPLSQLFGFLNGPAGILGNLKRDIGEKEIAAFMNQGGFDLIGTGRTKIETGEQLAAALSSIKEIDLDGLVIIGGDDSNTNAALLAEYFMQKECKTRVIGVPKTIDGDLRSKDIEIPFGFDSACKTYSELIGNIAKDALSAKKYYHFIKLMGRSASHITLECAISTHPNLALIGEERKRLSAIVLEIADLICKRYEVGKEYGVILIPEGLIEFIPEMQSLIASLNLGIGNNNSQELLGSAEKAIFEALDERIQKQLLLDRDPHGNIQLSQIDTQIILIELVKKELKGRSKYKGKFAAQEHFFGYEGRSCFPTNFDANYCTCLGRLSALAVRDGLTGSICGVQHLKEHPMYWKLKMVPIVRLMHMETRKGKEKPVIQKTVVDLKGSPFLTFAAARKKWEIQDDYRYPGPIQFFGESEITDAPPLTLSLEP